MKENIFNTLLYKKNLMKEFRLETKKIEKTLNKIIDWKEFNLFYSKVTQKIIFHPNKESITNS